MIFANPNQRFIELSKVVMQFLMIAQVPEGTPIEQVLPFVKPEAAKS